MAAEISKESRLQFRQKNWYHSLGRVFAHQLLNRRRNEELPPRDDRFRAVHKRTSSDRSRARKRHAKVLTPQRTALQSTLFMYCA